MDDAGTKAALSPALERSSAKAAADRGAVAALEVAGLSHSYGARRALDGVSFALRPGEFTVLLGLNGAGKSTLFSLVTRLYAHQQGTIHVFGAELDREPAAALARMGVVFQQSTLDLDLTIEQNLRYHAALHGMRRADAAAAASAELGRVELLDRRRDKVRALSGGQRRRVEIARALLHRPSLLLLDEPTVGLDVAARRFLLEHTRALCRDEGLTVLWATHLIDEVGEDARIVVLHRGRVLATGTVPELLAAAGGAANVRDAFDALIREAGAPS